MAIKAGWNNTNTLQNGLPRLAGNLKMREVVTSLRAEDREMAEPGRGSSQCWSQDFLP